jgi:hypothetical protein
MLKTLGKWVLVAVGIFVVVIAAAMAVGFTLPAQIEVTKTIAINRPPENVWWVLTDYNNLSLWHPQYRGSFMTSLPGEKPTRWLATYTDGRTATVEVSVADYPNHYAERIIDAKLPFGGNWKLDLERRELTTEVTVHSHAELHRPLDRVFVRLFVKPDLEVERILEGLKRRVETTTVKPSPGTI